MNTQCLKQPFTNGVLNYGDADISMVKRLKELEAENARFKRMYPESELKLSIAKDTLAKKF